MSIISLENSAMAMAFGPQEFKQFNSMKATSVDNAIKEFQIIIKICKKAFNAFKNMELNAFDALVGENACQIRASKIVDLAQRFLNDPIFTKEIDEMIIRIETIVNHITISSFKNSKKKLSFVEFFAQYKIDLLPLNSDLQFIVQSYWLAHTKKRIDTGSKINLAEVTDMEWLIKKGLTKNRAQKIVADMQKRLAESSIAYLIEAGEELDRTEENELVNKRLSHLKKDPCERICSPQFYNFDICLKRASQKMHSVVCMIHRYDSENKEIDTIKIHYRGNGISFEIQQKIETSQEPAIVIEGISFSDINKEISSNEFIEIFENQGFSKILMANMATHKLYPDKVEDQEIPGEDPRLQELSKEAEKIGCSRRNPSLFLAQHIYADKFENVINSTK